MPISTDELLKSLHWRYAVKQFDPAKKIPAETWAAIEDALVLSPSSYGLQPWKFFVVQDPATRQKLLPHSWGQKQIIDASHLVVLAVKDNLAPADAEKLIAFTSEQRGIPVQALETYKSMIINSLKNQTPDATREWSSKQVYIALGQLMAACAVLGVDSCPMEGFSAEHYDEILGLRAKGYRSVVVATVGYRSANDKNATMKKIRYPKSEMVEMM
jgi:nitroreductase